jgi:hypothetical protein
MSLSVAPLACYGLFSVLILWRAVRLDKADAARIAATRPPIMQDAEQETSWDDRVTGAVGYICGEVIGWIIVGAIWCLFSLARNYSGYTGVAAISCGVLILALVAWRALKADTKALDDPNDNPRAKRLINENREGARR